MKKLLRCLLGTLCLFAVTARAGAQSTDRRKVCPVEIRDLRNNPIPLPLLGEKHLLLFYVDPDAQNQNSAWRDSLEKHAINSPHIYAYGIINLKDTFWPNSLIRTIVRSTVKRTGADIYTDPDHLLRDAWNLGDVNDRFTLIFVTKELEIKFLSKGEMTRDQIDEFDRVIDAYR